MAIIPHIAYLFSPLVYFFLALMAIWVLVSLGQRCRSIKLAGLASELRLHLFRRDPLGLAERYEQLRLFRQGHARRARNVMVGNYHSHQIRLFDYSYETGLGLDRRTQQFSVAVVQVGRELPGLLVEPRAAGKGDYNLSGMEQVELSGVSDTQGYAVFCERDGFAQEYIGEAILRDLRQCEGSSLELQDDLLALYVPGRLEVDEYRRLRGLAGELAERFGGDKTVE